MNRTYFNEFLNINTHYAEKTWLMIGKGPSFEGISDYNLDEFVTIGLNHVAREKNLTKLDFLHIFDIDVFEKYEENLTDKVTYLLLPDRLNEPHNVPLLKGKFHRTCKYTLEEIYNQDSHTSIILRKFADADRLLIYRRGDQQSENNSDTGIKIGSFSGSTVINCLAAHKITTIRLIGIDGGNSYANNFDDLKDETLLTGGAHSFNTQFIEMAETRNRYGISIQPLKMNIPTVYVGARDEQLLAHEVLKYSINKFSPFDIDVVHLGEALKNDSDFHGHTDNLATGTPFSLQRFAIPKLNNYRGLAVYLDSDMQVFADINELTSINICKDGFEACKVDPTWGRAPQISVMLIDCAKVNWDISTIVKQLNTGLLSYEELLTQGPDKLQVSRQLSQHWNSLESYDPDKTRLIHYTSMKNQPWLSKNNKHADIWCRDLIKATKSGYISRDMVIKHINKCWIRPSLLWQVDNHVSDPMLIPKDIIDKDAQFVPPHMYGDNSFLSNMAGIGNDTPTEIEIRFRRLFAKFKIIYLRIGIHELFLKLHNVVFKIRRAISTGIGFK